VALIAEIGPADELCAIKLPRRNACGELSRVTLAAASKQPEPAKPLLFPGNDWRESLSRWRPLLHSKVAARLRRVSRKVHVASCEIAFQHYA
jgi:hypothetical protein